MRWLGILLLMVSAATGATDNDLTVCDHQPVVCLASLDEYQARLQAGSLAWWQLQIHRFDALFSLKRDDDLQAALRRWVDNPQTPSAYQPAVAKYYGKWLSRQARKSEATNYLTQALSGYQRLYQQQGTPELALKVLNLLVSLERFDAATDFARSLIASDDPDPVLNREVYAELGHIAHRQNERERHVHYRQRSVHWAKQADNDQQRSVAFNNYAVALRKAGDYERAWQNFLQALKSARKAGDAVLVNKVRLRLAELARLQQRHPVARQWLHKVELQDMSPGQILRYRLLRSALKKAETGAGN